MARASLKVSIPGLDIEALSEDGSAEDITKKPSIELSTTLKRRGAAQAITIVLMNIRQILTKLKKNYLPLSKMK